jgi:hypothetical protein
LKNGYPNKKNCIARIIFEMFLKGCGFQFSGQLDFVEEQNEPEWSTDEYETPEWDQDVGLNRILLQESDPWTAVVNRHEDELDQKFLNEVFGSSADVCPVCKLSKETMKSHKCWDTKCPMTECGK